MDFWLLFDWDGTLRRILLSVVLIENEEDGWALECPEMRPNVKIDPPGVVWVGYVAKESE